MGVKIIGISGNSGAGKTTLTKALAEHLCSIPVHWDDFDDISTWPEDYVDWYHRGENYEEFNYQALADVLRELKIQKSVAHPVLGHLIKPTDYIVFDAPCGRLHPQTGQYIDYWVHINVPLDVSLSRRIIRDFKAAVKIKGELLEELEYYLSDSRPLFLDEAMVKKADFVVDGMLSISVQVEAIKGYLKLQSVLKKSCMVSATISTCVLVMPG